MQGPAFKWRLDTWLYGLHRVPGFAGILLVVAVPSGVAGWLESATVPARSGFVRMSLSCPIGFNVFPNANSPLELRVLRKSALPLKLPSSDRFAPPGGSATAMRQDSQYGPETAFKKGRPSGPMTALRV